MRALARQGHYDDTRSLFEHCDWRQPSSVVPPSAPSSQPSRLKRIRRWLGPLAAIAVLLSAAFFSTYAYATSTIRSRAQAAFAAKFDLDLSVGEVELGWGVATIHTIGLSDRVGRIEPIQVDRVVISYDLGAAFHGRIRILQVDVYEPQLVASRSLDRQIDLEKWLTEKLGASAATTSSLGAIGPGLAIKIHDLRIQFHDEISGAKVVAKVDRLLPAGTRLFEFEGLDLVGTLVEDGLAEDSVEARGTASRLAKFIELSRLVNGSGRVSFGDNGLSIKASGEIADRRSAPESEQSSEQSSEQWSLAGHFPPLSLSLPQKNPLVAQFDLTLSKVKLERLPLEWLSRSVIRPASESTIDANISFAIDQASAEAIGTMSFNDLVVSHSRLATEPIALSFTANGSLRLDQVTHTISLREMTLKIGQVNYQFTTFVALPLDPTQGGHPGRLEVRLVLPSSPCQAVLESIPGLISPLREFKLNGTMAGNTQLSIDWANLDGTVLESTLDLSGCEVLSAPKRFSADRLRGSFSHRVPVGKSWKSFIVGPENPNFVPLKSVSRNLTRSILTTEDSRFYRHGGFVLRHFRSALVKNLKRGRFAYGGSSITMQVVKNVMLAREKTVARKLSELFLTWYLEKELSKDRIFEIYLNAIEFGPGIYGIGPAADQFFAKPPGRLNPVESAFISSILPAPTRRFAQYCRGWAGRSTNAKIDRILDHMLERNRLDEEQYLSALLTPLVFRGQRKEICRRYQNGSIGTEFATNEGTQ